MSGRRDSAATRMPKGKTNAPPISVKFHANDEQLEEFVDIDDGGDEEGPRGSPHRQARGSQDASPPASDPWRFFSDIKGKITKSVEEKITEIKSRNQEEGSSPSHKAKGSSGKDGKESSSVSDSEELSESSISKTCGAASTTEGVEMSSDDDTASLDKDASGRRKSDEAPPRAPGGLRHRFRFLRKNRQHGEGTVAERHLSEIRRIGGPEEEEIESGVEALEGVEEPTCLRAVSEGIDNFEVGDGGDVLVVKEVTGEEIREEYFKDCLEEEGERTVFAPGGFVDLRPVAVATPPISNYLYLLTVLLWVSVYLAIHYCSPYAGGFITGTVLCYLLFRLHRKLERRTATVDDVPRVRTAAPTGAGRILEVHAVTEYQPLQKYEGWVNEYPDAYDPDTYHVSHTQSVFLRLQGNLLRVSHSRNKVPKRAMWNEPEISPVFTHHRIYNLLGASVTLLPRGLARKRLWSKKYPICVTLAREQMCFDSEVLAKLESEDEKPSADKEKEKSQQQGGGKKSFGRFRKKEYPSMAQRFSKLTEDDAGGGGFDLDSDSRASTPSADTSEAAEPQAPDERDLLPDDPVDLPEEDAYAVPEPDPDKIRIYLFGRTDREKEDWFRRMAVATHKGMGVRCTDVRDPEARGVVSNVLIEAAHTEMEYLKYMNTFKDAGREDDAGVAVGDRDLLWLNSLLGRVLFDCVRDEAFVLRVRERIQRKLATIKLPYFIEELLVPELVLGSTSPSVRRAGRPVTDERGLWIELDVVYVGSIVLTLQTKLNLMRLKNPQAYERPPRDSALSAIYHSDVDDSAESSSDDDLLGEQPQQQQQPPQQQDSSGSKKLIKMVDRLTESKLFQAATDNKYVKKAMEGVSNTHLRLEVEVKSVSGTVVLNVPPPPSDRVWVGFRPVPEIVLSARPIVGERHVSYMMVTGWIERKLLLEFQKIMVIPNMEDFVIPVMNPKLPE